MLELRQSLPACIALSAVGGIVEVLATAILAYQDDQKKEGNVWSRRRRQAALGANVVLQIAASTIGNLLAPWFGPVSIVGPMFLSSQLVANMIVFGMVLGLEYFTKEMKVGTYVIVVAAVLLPGVGPAIQDGQDVASLLGNWYSLAWSAVVLIAMIVSSALLVLTDVPALPEPRRVSLLLVARCTAFATNLTTSRVMVLSPDLAALVVSIVLKVVSGAVMTHAIIVQSTAVLQARFVPLNASALILVNATTGLIIWEDWRVVGSWTGYVCVFVLLLLGNYLLLGEIELFLDDSPHYGTAGTVSRFRRLRRRASTAENESDAGITEVVEPVEGEGGEEGGSSGGGGGGSSSEGRVVDRHKSDKSMDDGWIEEGQTSADGTPVKKGSSHEEGGGGSGGEDLHATASREEAWSSVYGLNDAVHRGGGKYRQRNVFVIDSLDRSSSI